MDRLYLVAIAIIFNVEVLSMSQIWLSVRGTVVSLLILLTS